MRKTFSNTAATLAQARKHGRKIARLPEPAPGDLSEAYDIQDRLIAAMAEPVAGWKVGATGQAGMAALEVKHPVAGPIFRSAVHRSPARIGAPEEAAFIVEAEFAFLLGQDLMPEAGPFGRGDILDAVADLHPAIEIVDTRFVTGFRAGGLWVVADGSANLAFVHGAAARNWRSLDLASQQVEVMLNGAPRTSGSGAAVLGGAVSVLAWLVDHLLRRGIALHEGDWVSTGLLTDVIAIRIGDTCVADFGSLGLVEIARV